MATNYGSDAHLDYLQIQRHWHAGSEKYAGADALVTAIHKGWQPERAVYSEEYWHAGSRLVEVFHFELTRGDEKLTMPVISNPYLRRMLKIMKPTIHPIEEREIILRRQHSSNGGRAQ